MSEELDTILASLPEEVEELTPPVDAPPAAEATNVLDTLGDDEAIFLEGPTKAEVEQWKAQYPNTSVMATLLADGHGIVWRTVTRMEWRNIQNLVRKIEDTDKRDDILFSKIVLFPNCSDQQVVNSLPAGAITNVLNEFYLYAGFSGVAESLKL
jgi:hypothetical protein